MKQSILTIAFVLLVVAGVYVYLNRNANPSSLTDTPPSQTSEQTSAATAADEQRQSTYSLTDVSSHSNPDDCWLVIDGSVYDVTRFIQSGEHPGGNDILQGCGTDATVLFNAIPQEGRPHRQEARDMLPDYQIGTLTK